MTNHSRRFGCHGRRGCEVSSTGATAVISSLAARSWTPPARLGIAATTVRHQAVRAALPPFVWQIDPHSLYDPGTSCLGGTYGVLCSFTYRGVRDSRTLCDAGRCATEGLRKRQLLPGGLCVLEGRSLRPGN